MQETYSEYHKKRNLDNWNENKEFFIWMDNVECEVYGILGINLLDLPDEMFMDHYDDGFTYLEMAEIVINNNRIYIS